LKKFCRAESCEKVYDTKVLKTCKGPQLKKWSATASNLARVLTCSISGRPVWPEIH